MLWAANSAGIAGIMQEWIEAGAADGFNLMVDMLPSGLTDIGTLLVPEWTFARNQRGPAA